MRSDESADRRHCCDRNYLSSDGINRIHCFTDEQLNMKSFDFH